MNYGYQLLDKALLPSKTDPKRISAADIVTIGNYAIRYVKWKPNTVYPDHTHLDTEYIYVISGDMRDGNVDFHRHNLLTYPPGSADDNLQTNEGDEFILMRTSSERIKFERGTQPLGFVHKRI